MGLPTEQIAPTGTARYQGSVSRALVERQAVLSTALARLDSPALPLAAVGELLVGTLQAGGTILVAGNGGSAAEAQHFAAELVGRFLHDRSPYAALALTTDSSILTAVANDYGYQDVFVRQIQALGHPGDLLLAFSTSGESENLVAAATAAHERGMKVVAITGERPSRLEQRADLTVRVPAPSTPLVQELHMIITHILCGIVESALESASP